ncbi:hypothetical protein HDV00_001599 [Rhizophlyctis rosea]|nr:hypothetical protein HDV00_001599 [Rhizophlyctis rosea]
MDTRKAMKKAEQDGANIVISILSTAGGADEDSLPAVRPSVNDSGKGRPLTPLNDQTTGRHILTFVISPTIRIEQLMSSTDSKLWQGDKDYTFSFRDDVSVVDFGYAAFIHFPFGTETCEGYSLPPKTVGVTAGNGNDSDIGSQSPEVATLAN